jgi:hypothetical protein
MPSETVQLTIVGAPGEEIEIVLPSARGVVSAPAVVFRGVLGPDGTLEVPVARADLAQARIARRRSGAVAPRRDDGSLALRAARLATTPMSRQPIPAALLARHAEQLRRTGWPNL